MFDLSDFDEQRCQEIFIAKNATILGNVEFGECCTVMFQAVIRGDTAPIRIGHRTNLQDHCCVHADPGFPCEIGSDVTVGHHAMIHGAQIANHVLIGIGAIVLNGASIGEWSVVAAGALVPEGKQIPPRSLVMGVPGKIIRNINDTDLEMIRHAADHYVKLGKAYREKQSAQIRR